MMYDVIVIGGGPAGLAAALAARETGADKVLIIERDVQVGGILNQCIHNGFGLHHFKEELTGPEYAARFAQMVAATDIELKLETMVLEITPSKQVYAMNKEEGYMVLEAKAIVLTMGCRERTRGAIGIPGDRPAGIFSAGAAQRYVNIEGYMVGKRVVILGSGDIGLIMARRMSLEGANVLACIELMPYSNGLNRNIVQCLEDYNIPLYLSHTITKIKGTKRLEQLIVQKVDEQRLPIEGSALVFDCDTLLLSVGLLPENELSKGAGIQIDPRTNGPIVYENMETSIPGIFACGNVLHVHDLVDFVSAESQKAGANAAQYAMQEQVQDGTSTWVENGNGVTYCVPQQIRVQSMKKSQEVSFRVNKVYQDAYIHVTSNQQTIAKFKREHMAPGEMEKIILPAQLLQNIDGNQLSIAIMSEGML